MANIKISTFPNATLPMGSGDVVTGLQGGVNVNFSQEQILYGQNAVASSNNPGASLTIKSGAGDGSGVGGGTYILSGGGSDGGLINIYAGDGSVTRGGGIYLKTGAAPVVSGIGGQFDIKTGYGTSRGGDIGVSGGDGGNGGNISMQGGLGISGGGGGVDVLSGNGNSGGSFNFRAGNGTVTTGGNFSLYSGNGVTGGGSSSLGAGNCTGTGNAGSFRLSGGSASNGNGGDILLLGGQGTGSGKSGGHLFLYSGYSSGGAINGCICMGLPVTDPLYANGVWANHGVLFQSGAANYTGGVTTASLVGHTLNFVNGILISVT